jgi:glycosyltransferase involved in cell wall biosynthesis
LFVGTVQPRKNLARLLQAFAVVCQSTKGKVGLAIAGTDGPGAASMRDVCRRLGIVDSVHWLGYVSDAERRALYGGAVAFVFPSLYEGFGLPVLEAMAWGSPVISSNAASLPEVVGTAGLLIDPYSVDALATAMKRVLDDTSLRSTLIESGHLRAREFTWDRCAEVVDAAFDDAYSGAT